MEQAITDKTPLFPALGEMGQKLGADTEGAFHRELVQEIADRKEALRQILDSGIEADKGADLQKKIAAMDSAERIVDLVWHIARHADKLRG